MSRAVYIGGFGNGQASADRVGYALESYYDDVDPFTFSYSMDHPEVIRRAVEGADALTLSAGMIALEDTSPGYIRAVGAPLPTSIPRLLARTGLKTLRMHLSGIGLLLPEDLTAVLAYDASAVAELARHPIGNLGRLRQISRFNAVEAAIAARAKGIPVELGYSYDDEYFQPSVAEEARAKKANVAVTWMPGIHDELVIRPQQTLDMLLGCAAVGARAPDGLPALG